MNKEQLKAVCDYIFDHAPKETDFETISDAIRAVTGYEACTASQMAGDDAWMVPKEEAGALKGIKTAPGTFESLSSDQIGLLYAAVDIVKKVRSFLEMNDKVKDMELPNVEKTENSFLAYNDKLQNINIPKVTPIGGNDNLNNLGDFTPTSEVNNVPNVSDISHEFIHRTELNDTLNDNPYKANSVPTDKLGANDNLNELPAVDNSISNNIENIDPEIAKKASQVVSIKYSTEPGETVQFKNDLFTRPREATDNIQNSSELKDMLNDNPYKANSVPTDDLGDTHNI